MDLDALGTARFLGIGIRLKITPRDSCIQINTPWKFQGNTPKDCWRFHPRYYKMTAWWPHWISDQTQIQTCRCLLFGNFVNTQYLHFCLAVWFETFCEFLSLSLVRCIICPQGCHLVFPAEIYPQESMYTDKYSPKSSRQYAEKLLETSSQDIQDDSLAAILDSGSNSNSKLLVLL